MLMAMPLRKSRRGIARSMPSARASRGSFMSTHSFVEALLPGHSWFLRRGERRRRDALVAGRAAREEPVERQAESDNPHARPGGRCAIDEEGHQNRRCGNNVK